MGLMKRFLEEKITEFANEIGVDEELVYEDDILYDWATRYAQLKLMRLEIVGISHASK